MENMPTYIGKDKRRDVLVLWMMEGYLEYHIPLEAYLNMWK